MKWEGQAQQSAESLSSLMVGTIVAIMGMYILLVVEFRSYLQPLIILCIIPFGAIGAIAGHAVMGLEITLFSCLRVVGVTSPIAGSLTVVNRFLDYWLHIMLGVLIWAIRRVIRLRTWRDVPLEKFAENDSAEVPVGQNQLNIDY